MQTAPQSEPPVPALADEAMDRPVRHSLRFVTLAWMFGSAWMYLTTGATLTRCAQSLNMPEFGFGLLAAIPYAGAVFQLSAALLMERYPLRKRMFLIAGLAHRSLWLVIAAIPWVVPRADWWWWVMLLVLSVSTSLANFSGPAWLSWMADLVPARIRGRYLSRRGQYGRAAAFFITVIAGWTLDMAMGQGGAAFRRTISTLMVVAALCGMLDIGLHRKVDPAQRHRGDRHVTWRELLHGPLRDPDFRKFLGYNFVLTFAIGYVGQFIWLYLFDVVEMSNMTANMMLVAIPLLVSMLSYPLWGRLTDRLGCRPVLLIAGIFIVQGGASWIFVVKDHWWLGYSGTLLATLAWPGVELANLNLLLRISQGRSGGGNATAKHHRGSAYIAVHSMTVALGGTVSGVFAGVFAEYMKDWHGSLFGWWPLTYHGILLLISAVGRAAALLCLIGMHEPRAYTTREAARYMITNMYSNVLQATLAPFRGLGRLSRLTYRLPKTPPR